ncbi:hypothetical protein MCW82_31410 [Azospirillum doebereinerae]|uniref:Uncharacterized protein n=2 Tax=Azospirillum doebereinerae TaxID=92933 RepID=A0A433JEJ0_9PROT|nr:hypothetical protein [Azospirillum doebereinerae]MCG5244271.1 hypothetical protein [Azospirillum doebereinerae]RUQ75596.1 hypothetical protein EJ913_00285 [Azospirillum doebereinerae]
MNKVMRHLTRPTPRPLRDYPADMTRTEGGWFNRPYCPLVPRAIVGEGFLRDRLHVIHGSKPLPSDLTDEAVDATLRLMLRRGK